MVLHKLLMAKLSIPQIVIILAEERLRQIAALSLPLTTVTFQIKNVAEITKNDFFKQFDRSYQSGGG